MNIVVVYVYPVFGNEHDTYAMRFVTSYAEHPTQIPHRVVVVSNGGEPNHKMQLIMCPTNPTFLVHDDSGYDIGAYQKAAREIPCDIMVFCGGSTYIRSPIWLERVRTSVVQHGKGLYGAMDHSGDARFHVSPHLRTTGFWTHPVLMNTYPHRVETAAQRYPFEHGPECFTTWVKKHGFPVMCITNNGDYPMSSWGSVPQGFHRGNQSALIFGDRLSDPPFWPA